MMPVITYVPTSELTAAKERIRELEVLLVEIGNFAHDASTGPAVPDALWEVRSMAYSAITNTEGEQDGL